MKIGPKLALCFVAAAVLPLAAASVVFIKSSAEVGRSLANQGKAVLADRITEDLNRLIAQAAKNFAGVDKMLAEEVRFLAADVEARLARPLNGSAQPRRDDIILGPNPAGSAAAPTIDLERVSISIAGDGTHDEIAGTLDRLGGIATVMRTLYLRNRTLIDTLTITLESGLSVTFPGGAAPGNQDLREMPWYLGALERAAPVTFGPAGAFGSTMIAAVPLQYPDGRFAGVAAIDARLGAMAAQTMSGGQLPPATIARLITVPADDPNLLPHEAARIAAEAAEWTVHPKAKPLTLDGDDTWLKVVSDMRSGVPGLETPVRMGSREVWSFAPIGKTADADLAIAVISPYSVIDAAHTRAQTVVEGAFETQLQGAVGFALVAALLAAGAGIYGARTLTRPIRDIHGAAAKLADGDFSVRLPAGGSDEFGDLARGFNDMVPALEARFKVQKDLDIAREIQQHLMPKGAPTIDGFDIAGTTEYCDETGGDYLDFIPLPDHSLAAVIGDVTGHGVGAALLMASARATLRTHADHAEDAAALLRAVNRQLAGDISGGRFMTLLFARLTPGQSRIGLISCGHEPALIFDPSTGSFATCSGEGIPLGVDAEWRYEMTELEIEPGTIVIGYTDGLREAQRGDGEPYGLERLKAVIRREPNRASQTLCALIKEDLHTFLGDAPIVDDISILIIRAA